MAGNVRTGPRPRRWRVPQHPCSFGNKGLFAERSRGFTLRAERRTEAQEYIFGRHDGDDLPTHTNYAMPAHPAGRNAC
jgi:hypothetical protein